LANMAVEDLMQGKMVIESDIPPPHFSSN